MLALPVVLVACGGDDDDDASAETDSRDASPTAAGVAGTAVVQSERAKKVNEAHYPAGLADGKRMGRADAPVKIEAFEDFGCPHCLDFTADFEPVIFAEYVASGKASLEYKYFPLRQATGVAAIAAQCALEQGQFWDYHRALFIAQAEANEERVPIAEAFAVAKLREFAEDIGLDAAAFDTCVQGDAATAVVQEELRQANSLGLPGTPSFVINGQITPAPDTADGWRELLDGLLE